MRWLRFEIPFAGSANHMALITRRNLIKLAAPALLMPRRVRANFRHGFIALGGLQINLTFDSSTVTNSAPASYFTAANNAAAQLMAIGTKTPATINITCGFGAVGGVTMSNQNQSQTNLGTFASMLYTDVRAALTANNRSTSMAALLASLPGGSSIGGQSSGFFVPSAGQRILGLANNVSNPDAQMGIGTSVSSTFYIMCFLHEFAECMGRTAVSTPFNFSRFLSAGTYDFSGSSYNGYFSLDGGNTPIADYTVSAESPGDKGDFSSSTGPQSHTDVFCTNDSATISLSAIDIELCNAMGIQ